MTQENRNQIVEVSSTDTNTQQSPTTFQIVLVDIKVASLERRVECVQVPLLPQCELDYVALSYRWGEVPETMIDTEIGYMARLTSFDLRHFFNFCWLMTKEQDIGNIKYVWVDALCVNQINDEQRKATVYHMSEIYDRASYIVAVPDLHLDYLQNTTILDELTNYSEERIKYLYHLLHGHADQLLKLDTDSLNRHLAGDEDNDDDDENGHGTNREHRDYFGDDDDDDDNQSSTNLMHINNSDDAEIRKWNQTYNTLRKGLTEYPYKLYNYIYYLFRGRENQVIQPIQLNDDSIDHYSIDLHLATTDFITVKEDNDAKIRKWSKFIKRRNRWLQQVVDFLCDLIKDWSSRVWVISEYHIAKKKDTKKMKYWFLQLLSFTYFADGVSFFEFDFMADSSPPLQFQPPPSVPDSTNLLFSKSTEIASKVYEKFDTTMVRQLVQQNFFEMILKSKASKSDDRFYAVLPISKYSQKLISKDIVDSWAVKTVLDVRLKLFEWMDSTDKLAFLYMSFNEDPTSFTQTLPTFATADINWHAQEIYKILLDEKAHPTERGWNYDLNNDTSSPLTLIQPNDNDKLYKLHLKPKEYQVYSSSTLLNLLSSIGWHKTAPCKRLELELDSYLLTPTIVAIPFYVNSFLENREFLMSKATILPATAFGIMLIGDFEKNKWLFAPSYLSYNAFKWHSPDETCTDVKNTGFYIY